MIDEWHWCTSKTYYKPKLHKNYKLVLQIWLVNNNVVPGSTKMLTQEHAALGKIRFCFTHRVTSDQEAIKAHEVETSAASIILCNFKKKFFSVIQTFRPISKLPLIAKIIENVVFRQLSCFLTEVDIMDKFQSGFRTGHSNESALIRVLNYILLKVDSGNRVVLVLLDLRHINRGLWHIGSFHFVRASWAVCWGKWGGFTLVPFLLGG